MGQDTPLTNQKCTPHVSTFFVECVIAAQVHPHPTALKTYGTVEALQNEGIGDLLAHRSIQTKPLHTNGQQVEEQTQLPREEECEHGGTPGPFLHAEIELGILHLNYTTNILYGVSVQWTFIFCLGPRENNT